MYFSMDVDGNDVEGFAFRDYVQNQQTYCDALPIADATDDPACWHTAKANGDAWDQSHRMGGRPVGFDLRMGTGPGWGTPQYGQMVPQPVAMRIIYNACNCPASTFIGDQTPSNVVMQVGNSATVHQALDYQTNYIEFVYE